MMALKMTADRIAECGLSSCMMLSVFSCGNTPDEHRRDDGEVLGDVVGDRERRQRPAGDEQLLADLDDLDELRRVRVEVDHVAGLFGRLGAGVHGHADVGLGEGGRVVGAVSGHGDEVAAGLLGRMRAILSSGVASARKSSTPASGRWPRR